MKKKLKRISIFLLLFFLFLLFGFNASLKVSKDDKQYIQLFLADWKLNAPEDQIHQNLETELAFISAVQDSVIYSVRHDSISFDSVGIVGCYYRGRRGQCFDRAILLEKFFTVAGFKVRHIYTFFNERSQKIRNLEIFKKGLTSHALLEVKTKKGWMVVGTNSNWIGMNKQGEILDLLQLRKQLVAGTLVLNKQPTIRVPFWEQLNIGAGFKVLYGIYSRHGEFFESVPVESSMNYIGVGNPFPDYNLRMLLYNF